MNYGIRISQPGKDVFTCPEKDLVLTSKATGLKIVDLNEVGFQFSGGFSSLTISHDIPLPFLVKGYYYSNVNSAWSEVEDIAIDSSNIYVDIFGSTEDINPIFRYFILYG